MWADQTFHLLCIVGFWQVVVKSFDVCQWVSGAYFDPELCSRKKKKPLLVMEKGAER